MGVVLKLGQTLIPQAFALATAFFLKSSSSSAFYMVNCKVEQFVVENHSPVWDNDLK
jgi:hypothetical protein